MKKHLLILSFLALNIFNLTSQNLEDQIHGVWISQSTSEIWEFDIQEKTMHLIFEKSGEIKVYDYFVDDKLITFQYEKKTNFVYQIEQESDNRIILTPTDSDQLHRLYKYNSHITSSSIINQIKDKSFDLDGVHIHVNTNQEIICIDNDDFITYNKLNTHFIDDYVILKANHTNFIILDTISNGFRIGEINGSFTTKDILFNDSKIDRVKLTGSWCYELEVMFFGKPFIDYAKVIIEPNDDIIIHWAELGRGKHDSKAKLEFIEGIGLVTFVFGDDKKLNFRLRQFEDRFVLKELNERGKNHNNYLGSVNLEKNCGDK